MMKISGPGKILNMAVNQFFKKPATIAYPKGKMQVVKNYRGKLWFDSATCINCSICVRNCPSKAITIINEGTKEDRKMRAILDVGHCIFCCQCVDTCPKKSLSFSQNIDLANLTKEDLTVDLVKDPLIGVRKAEPVVEPKLAEPAAETQKTKPVIELKEVELVAETPMPDLAVESRKDDSAADK